MFRTRFILDSIKIVNKLPRKQAAVTLCNGRFASSGSNTETSETKQTVSKAMKAYLERAREHDEFMEKERRDYQIGKRHLANMMGEDPETFTQKDVDEAIEYLFPSALYDKKARPMMKPPEEVFPLRKAAEFDETGRPFHFLFYTGKPNYFKLLYDIVEHMNELTKFEDAMIRKGLEPDPNLKLELSGYQWLDKTVLEKRLVEAISDKHYDSLITTFERLVEMPYSYRLKDFVFDYLKPLMSHTDTFEAPKPQYDEQGRAFITTYECMRKKARGHVTLRMPGTGQISVNGQDITYFRNLPDREQVMKEEVNYYEGI